MKRSKPIRRSNPKRKAKLHRRQFGARGESVRGMACLLLEPTPANSCGGATEAAHVRSRGAGGTNRNLVPLCWNHHRQQHAIGIETFQERHGIDLRAAADEIAATLDALEVECGQCLAAPCICGDPLEQEIRRRGL